MQEVMTEVRAALGPDAIIVSSHQGKNGSGVKVVAAIEAAFRPPEAEKPVQNAAPDKPAQAKSAKPVAPVAKGQAGLFSILPILDQHGVPRPLGSKIEKMARGVDAEGEQLALAGALDTAYSFVPLSLTQTRPLLLAGASGAGKTSSIAKLAARATLEGLKVSLLSTDTLRTGGIEQLSGYGALLGLSVSIAETPDDLRRALAKINPQKPDLVLVDTAGINPFSGEELTATKELARAIDAEIIAVVAAGGDPHEAGEIAEAYARIGTQRFIATRLDTTRRFGSLLSFASGGPLAFAAVSATPYIAEGLQPINPVSLARLLTTPATPAEASTPLNPNKLVMP
jgi:flagellar biosynthesis protein FlhF